MKNKETKKEVDMDWVEREIERAIRDHKRNVKTSANNAYSFNK